MKVTAEEAKKKETDEKASQNEDAVEYNTKTIEEK